MRERRHEGEGMVRIALIFGKVKGDPAEQVPQRTDRLQPCCGPLRMLFSADHNQLAQLAPEPTEAVRRQILQAAHGRSLGHEPRQLFLLWFVERRPLVESGLTEVAQPMKELARNSLPEHELGRKP